MPRGEGERPNRAVRIEDDLWKPSLDKARREGTNISVKIRRWLKQDLAHEEDPVKERDELPVEGRPRSHLPEE